MSRLPRVAVGSVQSHACPQRMTWALLGALTSSGCQVQHFAARCCHNPRRGAEAASGQASRHLDSWLMPADECRAALIRGLGSSELAVVDGCFEEIVEASQDSENTARAPGGRLDDLCDWLDVPRLAVLDVARARSEGLPARPNVAGVLLDGVESESDFRAWSETLARQWGVRALGGLERSPELLAAIEQLRPGAAFPAELIRALVGQFSRLGDLEAIRRLAARRGLPPTGRSDFFRFAPAEVAADTQRAGDQLGKRGSLVVAVAFDAAFHCYFPDMLDRLEAVGVTVVDFSPLHDESLPSGTDVVYLGCGNTEHYARELSENHCMMTALRNHLCSGGRIFADGGGLAYLCQYVETHAGRWVSMVGALPAVARLRRESLPLEPVEVTLNSASWLNEPRTVVRGYLNPNWCLEANGPMHGYVLDPTHEMDVVGRYSALGSRVQINLATQPHLWRRFVQTAHQRELVN